LGAGEEARRGDDDPQEGACGEGGRGDEARHREDGSLLHPKKWSAQEEVTPKNKGKETAATAAGPFKGRRASPSSSSTNDGGPIQGPLPDFQGLPPSSATLKNKGKEKGNKGKGKEKANKGKGKEVIHYLNLLKFD